MTQAGLGGYDAGYRECPCFWGEQEGSLVRNVESLTTLVGARALDIGAGEGKNSVFLARKGCFVDAVDVSDLAIQNGQRHWGSVPNIRWEVADADQFLRTAIAEKRRYRLVVAYGLLHCLRDAAQIESTIARMLEVTEDNGLHVVCAFNVRRQELETAHPGFAPTLLPHCKYLEFYSHHQILHASDSDLSEIHPNNLVHHTHSLTRMIVRKIP